MFNVDHNLCCVPEAQAKGLGGGANSLRVRCPRACGDFIIPVTTPLTTAAVKC